MVVLVVADTGTGMPPDKLDAIFERFARLDQGRSRDRGGVGLGLAIARAIVVAHGGSVRVRSALGAGSVFELLLPGAASNGQAASAGRARPVPAPLLGADSARG
jgi:two-component system OmpR family sensor kinase